MGVREQIVGRMATRPIIHAQRDGAVRNASWTRTSTGADDPIGQARGSAFLHDVPMIRVGTIRLGTAFCLAR
jgi:hypothetical protein